MALVAKSSLTLVLACFHPWRKGRFDTGWILWPTRFDVDSTTLCSGVVCVAGGSTLLVPSGADAAALFVGAARASGCETQWLKKLTLGQTSIAAADSLRQIKDDDAPRPVHSISSPMQRR